MMVARPRGASSRSVRRFESWAGSVSEVRLLAVDAEIRQCSRRRARSFPSRGRHALSPQTRHRRLPALGQPSNPDQRRPEK
jgi:hypothetical protein